MKMHSLSQKLFKSYVGWFVLYMILLLLIMLGIVTANLRRNISETQEQLIRSIDENIQAYFETMNDFSIDLLNSTSFKQVAVGQLPEIYEEQKSMSDLFSVMYQEAYKMIRHHYTVGLLVDNEYYIWMGDYCYISELPDDVVHVYDTLARDETPVIKYMERNEYLERTGRDESKGKSYVTLARSMDVRVGGVKREAVLEVQVEIGRFQDYIREISSGQGGAGLQVNIYDSEGRPIYAEGDSSLSEYLSAVENGRQIVDTEKIFNDELTLVYTQDTGYLQSQMMFWFIAMFVVCTLVIGITVVITYSVSKQISKPIHEVCERIQEIDLRKGISYKEIDTDIYEVQLLSGSLSQMSGELDKALKEIIALNDYEQQAKMLALQAQMQPHFLFNTLMTISSMAEEEGNDRIYRICMNLTSMFRYISAKESIGVPMYEEIKYVDYYVEIMKERFPNSVVKVDIPLEILDCRIPKLTIQPLVENAFKYCNRQNPKINVTGFVEPEGKWRIEVEDNGKGFSKEKKNEIMKKCSDSLEKEKLLSNQIDGMGLVNVYVRLKLFYGEEKMLYYIEEGKGRIIIGGGDVKDGND